MVAPKIKRKGMQSARMPDISSEKSGGDMKLFGLKNCDTCRKAMKSLGEVDFVDVRADGVPENVMSQAFETFGAALVNTRSTTWRGLDESERARPALELLAEHPALMKRPLIERDGELFLGWTPDTRSALGVA